MENMEYFEVHQAEFEAQEAAAQEIAQNQEVNAQENCEIGEDATPTQNDINWGAIYALRDYISTFTDEQMGALKAVMENAQRADTAKARLYAEATTLRNNVEKLSGFLRRRNSDGILLTQEMGLTNAQIILMQKQLELEKELYNVLAARLSIFDVRVSKEDEDKVIIVEEE